MFRLRGIRPLSVKDIYVSPSRKFAWVTNPKAASTSIRQNLTGCARDAAYRIEQAPQVLGADRSLAQVIDAINAMFTFAFVRHPEQRLVSAYKNKIARNMREKNSYRPKVQILLGLDLDPYDINREVSFDDFLSVVLATEADRLDRHWRPQSMVLDVERVRYAHIGKLESFDSDWEKICAHLGLDAAAVLGLLSSDGMKKRSRPSQPTPEVSPAQRRAIRELYREDYARFGYE